LVHSDLLDGIAGAEAVLKHGAGAQVPQFGLDKRAQIARGAVLDAEYRVQIVVVLDDHAESRRLKTRSSKAKQLILHARLAGWEMNHQPTAYPPRKRLLAGSVAQRCLLAGLRENRNFAVPVLPLHLSSVSSRGFGERHLCIDECAQFPLP
jgi:hypothetical protein